MSESFDQPTENHAILRALERLEGRFETHASSLAKRHERDAERFARMEAGVEASNHKLDRLDQFMTATEKWRNEHESQHRIADAARDGAAKVGAFITWPHVARVSALIALVGGVLTALEKLS